jgi:hypothetical protein
MACVGNEYALVYEEALLCVYLKVVLVLTYFICSEGEPVMEGLLLL